MGLDGGTIATRSDILRGQSWRLANADGGSLRSTRGGQLSAVGATSSAGHERHNRQQDELDRWATCALSGAALPREQSAPSTIVGCALGMLYLRDAVVEWLTGSGQFEVYMPCSLGSSLLAVASCCSLLLCPLDLLSCSARYLILISLSRHTGPHNESRSVISSSSNHLTAKLTAKLSHHTGSNLLCARRASATALLSRPLSATFSASATSSHSSCAPTLICQLRRASTREGGTALGHGYAQSTAR